jgi:hypothetical protein
MKKDAQRKLTLRRETIVELDRDMLDDVAGGITVSVTIPTQLSCGTITAQCSQSVSNSLPGSNQR